MKDACNKAMNHADAHANANANIANLNNVDK